ncbi:hypothetical protein DFQ04_0700 [Algoriphagus boseongensis]|uniref:Uncharacterized protein n=1 Tax=Algoriphagus boseongensis TaxID=1442587 RepID=A0A4R6T9H4_9BACT|nr:hypothetical protein [Algoriphagus boseongensis]TDQ18889.1 hypothetical protein DFQ04_0700 [Algoriphagus boseongensis]
MKSCYLLIFLIAILTSCYSNKPLSKNILEDISEEERILILNQQLRQIEEGAKIQVKSISGKAIGVKYQYVSQDTLYANYNMPKNKFPTKIPLQDINEIKISKLDVPITIFAAGAGTALLVWMAMDGLSFSIGGSGLVF